MTTIYWTKYQLTQIKVSHDNVSNTTHHWHPPMAPLYKLNYTDITIAKDGRVGFHMVVRDHMGEVLIGGTKVMNVI